MTSSKRILQNIIGNKRHGGKNDWDFDGITNKKDCQPRNTMRQDGWFFHRTCEICGGKIGFLDFYKDDKGRSLCMSCFGRHLDKKHPLPGGPEGEVAETFEETFGKGGTFDKDLLFGRF